VKVLGYRYFLVTPGCAWLRSTAHNAVWLPGRTEARCSDHALAPQPGSSSCSAGLYAYSSLQGALGFSYHVANAADATYATGAILVPAVVVGWGRVVLHSRGWRSQFAQVVGIIAHEISGITTTRFVVGGYSVSGWGKWAADIIHLERRLADAYGVPLIADDPERWGREFGVPMGEIPISASDEIHPPREVIAFGPGGMYKMHPQLVMIGPGELIISSRALTAMRGYTAAMRSIEFSAGITQQQAEALTVAFGTWVRPRSLRERVRSTVLDFLLAVHHQLKYDVNVAVSVFRWAVAQFRRPPR
jgi:hypothetical protein